MITVIKSYFLPLSQLSAWPLSQVGQLGHHLGKLETQNIPLYPSFAVPISTLELIAEKNNLQHQVQNWFQTLYLDPQTSQEKLHAKLLKIFEDLIIPESVSEQFLKHYYATTVDHTVNVVASWINPSFSHLSLQSEVVKGDANVFETLLQTWSQSVWMALSQLGVAEAVLAPSDIFPAALLIQSHHRPHLSGFVLTTMPDQHKSQYSLFVDTQPQQPLMIVDVRTWHVLAENHHQLTGKKTAKNTLTHPQAAEISQLVHRIKLHDFQHLKVSWEITDGKIYITNLERLSENSLHQKSEVNQAQMLLIGTTVATGQTVGKVILLKQLPKTQQSFQEKIIVTDELSYLSNQNLEGLKGVITNRGVSLAAQLLLKTHHIPTLSHTKAATHRLHDGQEIVLDAHRGAVFATVGNLESSQTPPKSFSKALRSKLIANVTTAVTLEELPNKILHSVLFNSSEVWQSLKEHPLHVVKSTLAYQLQTQLTHTVTEYLDVKIPIIYRPMAIPTHHLQKLKQAHRYEVTEVNPDFGFYGATRLIHQPEPLALELQVLQKILHSKKISSSHLQFLIPLTRTPHEFQQVQHMLQKHNLASLPLWWEVAFPANIWEASSYPISQLEGVMVNISHLHHLLLGIDPSNPDLNLTFSFNTLLIKKALVTLLASIHPEKIWLQIDDHSQDLSALAVELGLAGVIVAPNDLAGALHQLQMAEQDWLLAEKQLH